MRLLLPLAFILPLAGTEVSWGVPSYSQLGFVAQLLSTEEAARDQQLPSFPLVLNSHQCRPCVPHHLQHLSFFSPLIHSNSKRCLTSRSMEVLMSSSLPSCGWTELMLKTILLWFWPSEDEPNTVHFCFPDLVKSHITSSPLGTPKQTASINIDFCSVCVLNQTMSTSAWTQQMKKPKNIIPFSNASAKFYCFTFW